MRYAVNTLIVGLNVLALLIIGSASASGTILEIKGTPRQVPTVFTAELKTGTSAVLKETSGSTLNSCTTSHLQASSAKPYSAETLSGPITSLTFGGCTRSITVHAPGKLQLVSSSGTNATLYAHETELTVKTAVGTLYCYLYGKKLGTLLGVAAGSATLEINTVIDCGLISSVRLEATYAVAVPEGLGVSTALAQEGTALEVEGIPKDNTVKITGSLESGSSIILKDTKGTFAGTCAASHIAVESAEPYTSASVTGPITALSFSNCTRPVTVHSKGSLEVTWSGGTNGTVASEGAILTVGSPVGTLTCATGNTVNIGTLTGAATGNAKLDINAVVDCGIVPSAKWEGTYGIMSPSGLGVSNTSTVGGFEVAGSPKGEAVSITASLKGGTEWIVKDTAGFSRNTCTEVNLAGSTISPYVGATVALPLSSFSAQSCAREIVAHAFGELEFVPIGGTRNATLYSRGTWVTVGSAIGTLNCYTGELSHLGILNGVTSGNATIEVNAVIDCGIIPSAKWEASLSVTNPVGLGAFT